MYRSVILIGVLFWLNGMAKGKNYPFLELSQNVVKCKPKFIGGLSSRYSIVSGSPVRIFGVYAGAHVDEISKAGLAFSAMTKPFKSISKNRVGAEDTLELKMSFFSVFYIRQFFEKDKWSLHAPITLGFGRLNTIRNSQHTKSTIVPLEVGVQAQYKVLSWLDIKSGLGLRFSFGRQFAQLSGPYYHIGLSINASALLLKIKELTKD